MSRRLTVRIALSCWCLIALVAAPVAAQERQSPPPEIRALVEAVMKAVSADAAAWEAMAKERFSAAHLKNTTPADRKELFDKIRADFGTPTFGGAVRRGPDAPLELQVKGSNGTEGTISLELDGANPPRIANIKVGMGGQARD